jgi:hypothetical protein
VTLHKVVMTDVESPRSPKLVAPNRFACPAAQTRGVRRASVRCSASGAAP